MRMDITESHWLLVIYLILFFSNIGRSIKVDLVLLFIGGGM
ncbi:hypothetical protein [Bacillus sp. FJAT-50079]|nr:hypothetical protein [Bacillus sp. FJAT-50079]